MPLTHTYDDAYLKQHITDAREARATADVLDLGSFATEWTTRLIILRAYILTALECQAQPDDLFSQKIKHYRVEFDSVLGQARAATQDSQGRPLPVLTIALERA